MINSCIYFEKLSITKTSPVYMTRFTTYHNVKHPFTNIRNISTWSITWGLSNLQCNCNSPHIRNNFLHSYTYYNWRLQKLVSSTDNWSTRYSLPSSEQQKLLITSTLFLTLTRIISGAINFITTIINIKPPTISQYQTPLFVRRSPDSLSTPVLIFWSPRILYSYLTWIWNNLTYCNLFFRKKKEPLRHTGGLAGIISANSSLEIVLHDVYCVVAHFHYEQYSPLQEASYIDSHYSQATHLTQHEQKFILLIHFTNSSDTNNFYNLYNYFYNNFYNREAFASKREVSITYKHNRRRRSGNNLNNLTSHHPNFNSLAITMNSLNDLKTDAIPGRLNQRTLISTPPGLYYGQCSEICGSNHSFMHVVLEFIPLKYFKK
eukprot:bmy_17610T0